MAEVTNIESEGKEDDKAKKKSPKKIILILIFIFAFIILIGGLFYFLTQGQKEEIKKQEAIDSSYDRLNIPSLNEPFLPKDNVFEKNPLFTDSMEFLINLNDGRRYLKFRVKLGLTDEDALEFLITRLPLVKDIIITTTRLLNSTDLNSATGIEQFKRTLIIKVNSGVFTQEMKADLKDPNPVKKILFEEFIIQ